MPIFAKFEGGKTKIRGDVKSGKHAGWLNLESVQFSNSRTPEGHRGVGGSRDGGSLSLTELTATGTLSDGLGDLFNASLRGDTYTVTIDFVKKGEDEPYMQVTLKGAMVSSYSMSGHGGDSHSKPMVAFSLNYTSIEYKVSTPKEGKSAALMQFDVDTALA